MATIMGKDVLIEVTASALAAISRQTSLEAYKSNPERKQLLQIREFLYSTSPEYINYDETLEKIQHLKSRCPTRE